MNNLSAFLFLPLLLLGCENFQQPLPTDKTKKMDINFAGMDHSERIQKAVIQEFDKEYAERRIRQAITDTTANKKFTSSLTGQQTTEGGKSFYYTSSDGYYSMTDDGEIVYTPKRVWNAKDSVEADTTPIVISRAPSLTAESLVIPDRLLADSTQIPEQLLKQFIDN